MQDTMKMAGHMVAHAIWSVSDGEILMPIVGHLKSDGTSLMKRLIGGPVEAMAAGSRELAKLPADALGVVFVKDTFATLETGKVDALLAEIRFAANDASKLQLLVPYRNANHAAGFAVHAIRIAEFAEISRNAVNGLMQAFMAGLESHEEGGKLWAEKYIAEPGATAVHVDGESTEFTPDEFEVLKSSAFIVCAMIAGADGKIEKKEIEMFVKVMTNAELLDNPLMNRIATNVIQDIPGTFSSILSDGAATFLSSLLNVRQIVDAKLPAGEANEFKLTLLKLGYAIANASGGGLFGFGSKVSKDEKKALAAIATCLGVSVQ